MLSQFVCKLCSKTLEKKFIKIRAIAVHLCNLTLEFSNFLGSESMFKGILSDYGFSCLALWPRRVLPRALLDICFSRCFSLASDVHRGIGYRSSVMA
jgi:hypothetical protein